MNNSSLTWAHVFSASDSNISSDPLRFLQFFSLIALIEFLNIRETEKGLKPPLVLSWWDSFFSLRYYYLANPNGEGVRNWNTNHISTVHENPTVSETGIVVLLRPFWVSAGKKKGYDAKGISLSSDIISKFPTVGILGIGLWTCCLNCTTIQRWINWRSSFFWDRFGGLREKERILRGEGEKRKWEKKEAPDLT